MKKIYVTRSSMPSKDEYFKEISELWDTHFLTNMGSKHELFRDMLKDYLHIDSLELLVNGHMALEMTIQAFEFPADSEVITTPFSFVSTTHAITRNGLKPVFCDIDPDTYCIDADKIEELIGPKTVAIVPVHVYGNICDVDKIKKIAEKHNIKVIYDAAHAFGVEYNGKSIARYGDAAIFSFHATKVFNSIEGGAVAFKNENIGRKLYELKNFGIHDEETISYIGANAKMNEFCASMGICNLRHLDDEIEKRQEIYNGYINRLKVHPEVFQLPLIQDNTVKNYSYIPVVFKEGREKRDYLYEKLKESNIFTRKYFYPLISDLLCYRQEYGTQHIPTARYVSDRVLTLPLYSELTMEEVNYICDKIMEAMKIDE